MYSHSLFFLFLHKAQKGIQDFFPGMQSYFIIVSMFMPLV